MALIVQKFGGTSVGSIERIRNVARRALSAQKAGNKIVLVVSAMSGETNRLLGLAKELAPGRASDDYNRELDMLASTGEQASSALLAIALQAEGMPSVSYAGWQVSVRTDSAFTKARIESIEDERVAGVQPIHPIALFYVYRVCGGRMLRFRRWTLAAGTGVAKAVPFFCVCGYRFRERIHHMPLASVRARDRHSTLGAPIDDY